MKKAVCVALAIVLSSFVCINVNAQSAVDIKLSCDKVQENRLFDVSFCASTDELLSGGEFEISFDSKIVEYRDAESEVFKLKSKCEGDKITVVFASADGLDVKKSTEIFSLKFKSICNGDFDISLHSVECIDEEFNKLSINCDEYNIAVDKRSVKITSNGTKAKEKSQITMSNAVKIGESATVDSIVATADVTELQNDNGIKDVIFYGALAVVCFVAVFLLGILFSKFFVPQKHKDK